MESETNEEACRTLVDVPMWIQSRRKCTLARVVTVFVSMHRENSTVLGDSDANYSCLFCGEGIMAGTLDPCAIHLVAKINCPRNEQKEQTFFCHFNCIKQRAAIHPDVFYIAEPDFPSVGDCDLD